MLASLQAKAKVLADPNAAGSIASYLGCCLDPVRAWRHYLIASTLKHELWSGVTARLMVDHPAWGTALVLEMASGPANPDFAATVLEAALLTEHFHRGGGIAPCHHLAAFLVHQELMDNASSRKPCTGFFSSGSNGDTAKLSRLMGAASIDSVAPYLAFGLLRGNALRQIRQATVPAKVRLGYLPRITIWVAAQLEALVAGTEMRSHFQSDFGHFTSQALHEAIITAMDRQQAFDGLFGTKEAAQGPSINEIIERLVAVHKAAKQAGDRRTASLIDLFLTSARRAPRTLVRFYTKCAFEFARRSGFRGDLGGVLIAEETDPTNNRLPTPAFESIDATVVFPARPWGGTGIDGWRRFGRIAYVRDDRSELEKVVVYRLDNATVLPCGRVVTADNLVLPLSVHGVTSSLPQLDVNVRDMTRHPSVLAQREGLSVLKNLPPHHHVKAGVLFSGYFYTDNFGHFIYHGLPKVFALQRIPGAQDATVIIPGPPARFHGPVLSYLGLPETRYCHTHGESIRAETLYVVQEPPLGLVHFSAWEAIRNGPLPDPGRSGQSRIYISRALAGRRGLSNEAQIIPLLEARGFVVVHPDAHSFPEQMRILNSADFIVAPHGSALAPLAICPPRPNRTKLIELFSKNVYDRTAPAMWYFGTDHYALLSETQLNTSEDNFHIDPDRLISLVDALLERPALSDAVEPTVVNMH